jgi:hypothetical protein
MCGESETVLCRRRITKKRGCPAFDQSVMSWDVDFFFLNFDPVPILMETICWDRLYGKWSIQPRFADLGNREFVHIDHFWG